MQTVRGCGVLLHPTSLPGTGGIGTLGENAFRFIDLLENMGMSSWQVLPLNPAAAGNSPYSSFSAFAGNPLLIDIETLAQEGDADAPEYTPCESHRIDYGRVMADKGAALRSAAAAFFAAGRSARMEEFWHFCDTTPWLHDYALFMALKQRYGGKPWHRWPVAAAFPDGRTYEKASVELGTEIGFHKYVQWQFFRQWGRVREYAAARGIGLIGDIPIFVAYDSVDVWRNRDLFLLDGKGRPFVVAGVPPDYFSATGQLWGNPLYNWDRLEERGFDWWVQRFKSLLAQFDRVRIDHFRGFEAAWHVPAGQRTAVRGAWVTGPGEKLFDAVFTALGPFSIIAEDLGIITPRVIALRDRYGFPGMKILQFAFGSGSGNAYLPHNHIANSVVYTGTHDNDTSAGWFDSLDEGQRSEVREYLGGAGETPEAMLTRGALMSVADTVIIPLQDLLGLPGTARMNVPGTPSGNWEWRFSWEMVPDGLAADCRRRLGLYGRARQQ